VVAEREDEEASKFRVTKLGDLVGGPVGYRGFTKSQENPLVRISYLSIVDSRYTSPSTLYSHTD
jgi:hypothetical protein